MPKFPLVGLPFSFSSQKQFRLAKAYRAHRESTAQHGLSS